MDLEGRKIENMIARLPNGSSMKRPLLWFMGFLMILHMCLSQDFDIGV